MADMRNDQSRQERLSARLRENLRRRKARVRELAGPDGGETGQDAPPLPKSDAKS
jgi:hypothetical protein